MASIRSAVVTGANKGIGLELTRQLCEGGSFQKVYALCRKTSPQLSTLSASNSDKVSIVEGIDVMNLDDAIAKLKSVFRTNDDQANLVPISLLIHNAGAFGPSKTVASIEDPFATQNLSNIDADAMMYSFQLNTLAPLFITKALLPNLKEASAASEDAVSKVIVISSFLGSIEYNTRGSAYAYRTSKAAVNMVGKNLSIDLKKDKIAVGMIHPGMVFTEFFAAERPPGQRDVDVSVKGVLQAVDQVTMATTGCFLDGNYGEGVKPLAW